MLYEILLGSACLGALAGLMGPFLVVRRLSLVSDALAHALIPGLLIAFMLSGQRNFFVLAIGAWLSSLLAAYLITFFSKRSRVREDSAIGIVLSGFFAGGALLLGWIQKGNFENKAGLDRFFLGQMAALNSSDLKMLMATSVVVALLILVMYPRLRVLCFDEGFSASHDPVSHWIEKVFYFVLVMVLVLGIHAVGVLLISAMLVIPAATSLLFSKRLSFMVILSGLTGALSACVGMYVSTLGPRLPTGAIMVLVSSLVFGLSFLFISRESLLARLLRNRARELKLRRENSLKALYQLLEWKEFKTETLLFREFASKRNQTLQESRAELHRLQRAHFVVLNEQTESVSLTPQGWTLACSIVRNHRLWELYLCLFENKSAEEVHEEAEFTEHYLSEESVARIERMLKYPHSDPHGKVIPSVRDMAMYEHPKGAAGMGSDER